MLLSEILRPDGVRVLSACQSKKRLFQALGDLAEGSFGLSHAEVMAALCSREELGPTGVGNGVALPHARLKGLDAVKCLFVRLEKPLDFDAVDRQPVDLVCALFAPSDAGVEHLKALALVSRTMRDRAICTKLRANTDPATLFTILTEISSTQAA